MGESNKVVSFFKNDHIQSALVSGLCIIALAFFSKRMLHVEITNLEQSAPGLVFTLWEVARAKNKSRVWTRPLYWNLAAIVVTAIIILNRVWN